MAHLFESGFFVGEAPWHGLGNIVPAETRYSVHEGLIAAGLNWDVYTRPCGYMANGQFVSPTEEVTNKKGKVIGTRPVNVYTCRRMLVPTDNGTKEEEQILGCVGGTYTPVQNADIFKWFQPYLDKGEATLHTAGSLNSGRWVWCLAKLNRKPIEVVPGDTVEKFLLLSSSHDGSLALRVGFTPIRVVCANTLALAHSNKESALLRLKHTKMVHVTLDNVHDIVNTMDAVFEATAEQFRLLASRKVVNPKDLERFVIRVMTGDDTPTAELSTKMRNIIFGNDEQTGILPRMASKANTIGGMEGSWWAAYNAMTEYLTWASGGEGGDKITPADKANNRLSSLWLGRNATVNQSALTIALEMAAA